MLQHLVHLILCVAIIEVTATEEENVIGSRRKIRSKRQEDSALINLVPLPCPGGQPYCDITDDYPTDLLKDILDKQPKHILDHYFPKIPALSEVAVNKWGDDPNPNDYQLCESELVDIFPTRVQDPTSGLYEFVVNTEERKQGVRLEKCKDLNSKCMIPGGLANGYISTCEQKYISRLLVVINQTATSFEGLVTKPYDFPSCCACHITFESDDF